MLRKTLTLTLLLGALVVIMGMHSATAAASGGKTVRADIKLAEDTKVCVLLKGYPSCVDLKVGAVITVSVTYFADVSAGARITTERCDLGLCVFVHLDAFVAARIDVWITLGDCGCPPTYLSSDWVGAAAHERKLLCLSLQKR